MAKKVTVDFSNVKERGNFNPKRVQEGDYRAVITKVEDGESKKDNEFQYIFTLKLKKFSQNSYPYYCKVTESQLWKLRNLMVAAGFSVPKKRMAVDPNKAVGREVGVTMEDDEYEGKLKSVIASIFPVSELEDGGSDDVPDEGFDEDSEPEATPADADDDTEDEAPKEKKKGKKDKKGKKKKGDDGENLEELDISDL
jgi:hypothetical protein